MTRTELGWRLSGRQSKLDWASWSFGPDKRKRYRGLRIRGLRHTPVTCWIAAGASPKQVATWAGHSPVVTVLDRRGHLLPDQEDRVTDVLGDDVVGGRADAVSGHYPAC
jgi:integrase